MPEPPPSVSQPSRGKIKMAPSLPYFVLEKELLNFHEAEPWISPHRCYIQCFLRMLLHGSGIRAGISQILFTNANCSTACVFLYGHVNLVFIHRCTSLTLCCGTMQAVHTKKTLKKPWACILQAYLIDGLPRGTNLSIRRFPR